MSERLEPERGLDHYATISRALRKAKQERVQSIEFEAAASALRTIQSEHNTLRRENEQITCEARQTQDELQRTKEEAVAKLSSENERLTQMLLSMHEKRGDVTKLDPFLNLVNTYMQENRRSRCTPNEHERAENRERAFPAPQSESASAILESSSFVCRRRRRSSDLSHEVVMVSAGVMAQRRRSRRPSSASSVSSSRRNSRNSLTSEDHSILGTSGQHPRRHSETCSQVVVNAGVTAQRRRMRRSQSATSTAHSWRNSHGLSSFLHMLNYNTNNQGEMSWLACLILHLLSNEGRPVEAATLQSLLTGPTTSAKAEYFLRYTVVRDLVTHLQSPNSERLFTNVHPFLLESSTHFLEMLNKQQPVASRHYSCPTHV